MFSGDPNRAKRIFEVLYRDTKSVRVKLEWARAAYLAMDYAEARLLFQEVLDSEGLPDSVRFNISLYLSEVENLSDSIDYRASFVTDTNPFAVPRSQRIRVFGIPFDYVPTRQQETLTGINYGILYSRSIHREGLLRLLLEWDGTRYEGVDNSKWSGQVTLETKLHRTDKLSYRIGYSQADQRGSVLAEQPFVSLNYRSDMVASSPRGITAELKHSRNYFPEYPWANGSTLSASMAAVQGLSESFQTTMSFYFDQNSATNYSQAYGTSFLAVGIRFFSRHLSARANVNLAQSIRRFEGVDELFLTSREDKRTLASLSVQPYSIRIFSLFPAIELGLETVKSTVPINSFDRQFINFSLRKKY
jgi:hypothetical protein